LFTWMDSRSMRNTTACTSLTWNEKSTCNQPTGPSQTTRTLFGWDRTTCGLLHLPRGMRQATCITRLLPMHS
jgi:hypothetical protein